MFLTILVPLPSLLGKQLSYNRLNKGYIFLYVNNTNFECYCGLSQFVASNCLPTEIIFGWLSAELVTLCKGPSVQQWLKKRCFEIKSLVITLNKYFK
jgi:hypothetical protein